MPTVKSVSLKSRIAKHDLVLGSWMSIPSTAIAEILSSSALDFLVIDLEHSCINIKEAEELIRIIDLKGKAPLVRLSSIDGVQAKRVMDAGAHGIIVPMVKTVEEAKQIVSSVHFPPFGYRGVGLARAQQYGQGFNEYFQQKSKETVVIVQIEHIESVRNFEAIMSVSGVDGFIIGPYDLSASMGIPGQFENPDFKRVLEHLLEISKKLNYYSGIHIVEPEPKLLAERIASGYKFIAYSVDFRMLATSVRQGLSHIGVHE